MVGKEKKEFVYEVTFPDKTNDEHAFVEQLWARRKVGYMLDQIRANGEKKELVDEVTALAKKYGITTPYTSYLIVPDAAVPVAQGTDAGRQAERELQRPGLGSACRRRPWRPAAAAVGAVPQTSRFRWRSSPSGTRQKPGDLEVNRGAYADRDLAERPATRKARDGQARQGGQGQEGGLRPGPSSYLRQQGAGGRPGRQAGRGSVAADGQPAQPDAAGPGGDQERLRPQLPGIRRRLDRRGLRRQDADLSRSRPRATPTSSCWNGSRRSRTC